MTALTGADARQWTCPACNDTCTCAACQRTRRNEFLTKHNVELETQIRQSYPHLFNAANAPASAVRPPGMPSAPYTPYGAYPHAPNMMPPHMSMPGLHQMASPYGVHPPGVHDPAMAAAIYAHHNHQAARATSGASYTTSLPSNTSVKIEQSLYSQPASHVVVSATSTIRPTITSPKVAPATALPVRAELASSTGTAGVNDFSPRGQSTPVSSAVGVPPLVNGMTRPAQPIAIKPSATGVVGTKRKLDHAEKSSSASPTSVLTPPLHQPTPVYPHPQPLNLQSVSAASQTQSAQAAAVVTAAAASETPKSAVVSARLAYPHTSPYVDPFRQLVNTVLADRTFCTSLGMQLTGNEALDMDSLLRHLQYTDISRIVASPQSIHAAAAIQHQLHATLAYQHPYQHPSPWVSAPAWSMSG